MIIHRNYSDDLVKMYRFLVLLPLLSPISFVEGLGGEKATLTLEPFSTDAGEPVHRQNFCEQYRAIKDQNDTSTTLKDALNGLQINTVLQYGSGFPYFNYHPETGIDSENPGIVADILDEMAKRANFTWRQSFAVYTGQDKSDNYTWTEMLKWATDTYDISIDKW